MQTPEQSGSAAKSLFLNPPKEINADTEAKIFFAILDCLDFGQPDDERRGLDAFTQPQQRVYAVFSLDAEIKNESLDQYFYEAGGDNCLTAYDGLRAMGLNEHLALFTEALKLFKGRDVEDREERQAALDHYAHTSGVRDYFAKFYAPWNELARAYAENVAAFIEANYAACFRHPPNSGRNSLLTIIFAGFFLNSTGLAY